MRSRTATVFHDYIVHELNVLNKQKDDLEIGNSNLFGLIYSLRYVEDYNPNKIYPNHMKLSSIKESKYTEAEIDELGCSDIVKAYMKSILRNDSRVQLIRHQIKILTPFSKIDNIAYFMLLHLVMIHLGKIVLKGYEFAFGYGLGYIQFVKYTNNKEYIDWAKSVKNRQEIIAGGGIPYYEEDERVARMNGVEYNGIKWLSYTKGEAKILLNWRFHKDSLLRKTNGNNYTIRPHSTLTTGGTSIKDISKKPMSYVLNSTKVSMMYKLYELMNRDKTYYLNLKELKHEI